MELQFDTELFIDLVKNNPCIWNPACEEYHDRIKKKAAWASVCGVICKEFNEKSDSEKTNIGKKIMNRWKNILDNYKKSEKKRTKSGQGTDSSRRYVYARQLSFLEVTIDAAPTETSIRSPEIEDNDSIDLLSNSSTGEDLDNTLIKIVANNSEPPIIDQCEPQKKSQAPTPKLNVTKTKKLEQMPVNKRRRMIEDGLVEFMKQPSTEPTSETKETDDDKLFFDSLIPAIKTLSVDNKLAFRCELMQLVCRFRKVQNAEALSQSLLQPLSVQTEATSQGHQQLYAGNRGPSYCFPPTSTISSSDTSSPYENSGSGETYYVDDQNY